MRLLEAGCADEVDANHVPFALARDGVVFIRRGSVDEVREMLDHWTEPASHPHQSADGLTIIVPRQRSVHADNEAGFSNASLPPHTDRSLVAQPPSLLATLMVTPAATGGESILVDGARVLTLLRREFGEAVIAGLRLTPRQGSDGPCVVEQHGHLARFRYRDDRVAGPYSDNGQEDALETLRRLILATTATVRLGTGDGYLIHNHRFLHGRTAFRGARRLVRLLAQARTSHPYAWLNRGFRLADS